MAGDRVHTAFSWGVLSAMGVRPASSRAVLRGCVLLAALTWLPLAVIAAIEGGSASVEPLVRDLSVHMRLLVGVPLGAFATFRLNTRCAEVHRRLVDEGYVHDPAVMAHIAETEERPTRSVWVSLILLLMAIALSQVSFWGVVTTTGAITGEKLERVAHGPAGIWYAWVALPIFYFVFLRLLLRWGLWVRSVGMIASLPLDVDAAHPDMAGGIGFVAGPSRTLTFALFATGAVLAGAWETMVLHDEASAASFIAPIALWVVIALITAFGPLVAFAPLLNRTQRAGKHAYGSLSIRYIRSFRQRWLAPSSVPELLGTPDIQSLSDLNGSFAPVHHMRLVPFGPGEILIAAGGALLPMLPFALTRVPLSKLLSGFLKTLL
jgi:hypothetical protein